jgi:hypothetical protein
MSQRLGIARIALDPRDEERATALELAVLDKELRELQGRAPFGRHVAIALGTRT